MNERLKQRLLQDSRTAVITATLLTLLVTGGGVFEGLVADSNLAWLGKSGVNYAQLGSLADQGAENMARGGRPVSHKQTYLVLPLLRGDNSQSRFEKPGEAYLCAVASPPAQMRKGCLVVSASLVSSALGLQFTLLGAKPSGTS
jgi:hypothetical protein